MSRSELGNYNGDRPMGSLSLSILLPIEKEIEIEMEKKTRMSLWRTQGGLLASETCLISIS
jgi:hypothetical protein